LRTKVHTLALALALPLLLALAGCGGAPPPPVARATPAAAGDAGLQPLSSRDAAGKGAADGAPSGSPQLPPGHPPVGPLDPHGNAAGAGASRSAGSITGTISVAAKLPVGPSDVLYVIAKKAGSTLAVKRVERPAFPLAFEISGADAMTPGVAFDGPLDLVARVSRSGDAIPSKGDIEGTARGVKVPAKGIVLTIDSVRE
jgi:hypothetical protein